MMPDKRGFVTASADQTVKFWQFELIAFEGQKDSEGKRLSVVHTRTLQLEEDALAVKVIFYIWKSIFLNCKFSYIYF
jgi:U3 small nucleolar RNA-associated protein 12